MDISFPAKSRLRYSSSSGKVKGGFSFLDNHPSGSLKASDADQKLTKKNVKTDKLLDMKVFDHIILPVNPICKWQMKD
jgi:hypothetical protein